MITRTPIQRSDRLALPAPMLPIVSPFVALYLQRRHDMTAALYVRPDPLAGITSGPGNSGSANTAHLTGHAGTGANQISLPRQLKFGTGTYVP